MLTITDCTSLVFEFWTPDNILSKDGLKSGDVIRIKSCVASPSKKTILVAGEQTNVLIVPSTFKLHKTFHSKIENTEFNLSMAILGGQMSNKPSSVQ